MQYPDEINDLAQLTMEQFVGHSQHLFKQIKDLPSEVDFIRFVLAGRVGQQATEEPDQCRVTLNCLQGLPPLPQTRISRDLDSAIGASRTLPYTSALAIWPVPPFKEMLTKDNHAQSHAYNAQGDKILVPMHKIPNVPLGKVQQRHVVRILFPRLYSADGVALVSQKDLALIYDHCLHPTLAEVLPEFADRAPTSYAAAYMQSRTRSGTYFICDIVMNTGRTTFLRLPLQRTFDPESMARIYHKASINDVRASFDRSNVVPSKQLSNAARTHNRNRNTGNIDDVRDPERQALDMEIRGVVVKPAVRLAGRDLDLRVLNGGDERDLDDAGDPQVELSASQRVAKIYEQFIFHVIEQAPNKKPKRDGSYLTIPDDKRIDMAQPELLQVLELPFDQAQYCVCTPDQWTMHFDRIFPRTVQEARASGQNFPNCSYYKSYIALASAVEGAHLIKIRAALRKEFDKLAWAPWTLADRMWGTGAKTSGEWKVLPREKKGGPMIAINPRRHNQRVSLRVFDQPDEDYATNSNSGED